MPDRSIQDDSIHRYAEHDFTFTEMTRPDSSDPYMEALRQLGADTERIMAGTVTIREYVTPDEHALLLAARELASARQANTAAGDALVTANSAANAAMEKLSRVRRQCEAALAAVIYPAETTTGEGDCS